VALVGILISVFAMLMIADNFVRLRRQTPELNGIQTLKNENDEDIEKLVPKRWEPTWSELDPSSAYDRYWLVLSKSRKVAITFVPKVMCTTIRSIFTKIEQKTGMCNHTRCSEWRKNKNIIGGNGSKYAPVTDYLQQHNYTTVIMFR
jgi:hypothetical protein